MFYALYSPVPGGKFEGKTTILCALHLEFFKKKKSHVNYFDGPNLKDLKRSKRPSRDTFLAMPLQPAIVAILTLLVQTRAQFEIQPPDMSLLDGGGLRMAYPGIMTNSKLTGE